MDKKMIIGLFLLLLGVIWGIVWRLQSARNATYDNFDPGYLLFFPGIIIYFIGLNKQSAAIKGWGRFFGNFLVFIGGFSLFGLGQYIGTTVFGKGHFNIIGFVILSFLILLFPLGSAIVLKQRK